VFLPPLFTVCHPFVRKTITVHPCLPPFPTAHSAVHRSFTVCVTSVLSLLCVCTLGMCGPPHARRPCGRKLVLRSLYLLSLFIYVCLSGGFRVAPFFVSAFRYRVFATIPLFRRCYSSARVVLRPAPQPVSTARCMSSFWSLLLGLSCSTTTPLMLLLSVFRVACRLFCRFVVFAWRVFSLPT